MALTGKRLLPAGILPLVLACVAGMAVPDACFGGVDPAASPVGSASVVVTEAIGSVVPFIQLADQNVPVQSTSHSDDTDTTKDGVRRVEHTIQSTAITVTIGHAVADAQVSATTTRTNAANGAAIDRKTSLATAHFDVNTCPDANGIAEGNVKIWLQAETTTPGGASSGGVTETSGPIRLIDGDDAHLVRTEATLQMSSDIHGIDADGGQQPFESSVSVTRGMTVTPDLTTVPAADYTNGISSANSGKYHPERAIPISELIFLGVADQVAKAAEKFWRSGKCITLRPSEKSRNVAPGEKVSFTVDSIHKLDGAQVNAPIRADLTGPASLDPNAKPIDPPATFDYVAGQNPEDNGSIALRQVGKRGIGAERVAFTVRCRDVSASLSASVSLTGMGHDFKGHLSLEKTKFVCDEDGNYRATGSMTVTGSDTYHADTGEVTSDCTQPVDYTQPVKILLQFDESDKTKATVQITPQDVKTSQVLKCRSSVVVLGHVMHPQNTRTFNLQVLAVDLWGRMMARRQVTLGQPQVISASFAQGLGRATTDTTLLVVAPNTSP